MISRLLFALAGLAVLAAPAAGQTPVSRATAEIVATYPHDTGAFTQGLFIEDGVLFESTGQVGASGLRQVILETGHVERQTALEPPYFGEGSVQLGSSIYMLTWQSETGFIFDAGTFERIGTFDYEGQGWGLTHDGTHLILSDGTAELRVIDPADFSTVRTIAVTLAGRPVRVAPQHDRGGARLVVPLELARVAGREGDREPEVGVDSVDRRRRRVLPVAVRLARRELIRC